MGLWGNSHRLVFTVALEIYSFPINILEKNKLEFIKRKSAYVMPLQIALV